MKKLLQKVKEKNVDYNNNSFLKSANDFINSKKDSLNYRKNKKKINRFCNLLIYDNNEKKYVFSNMKNNKSFVDRSKLIDYINFKISNRKKVENERNANTKNKSCKIENKSRNFKNSNTYTNTNSITIENNNTNYISPKQYEKEETINNNIIVNNNMTTPFKFNAIISKTNTNSSKMTVSNSNKKVNNNNININYNSSSKDKKVKQQKNILIIRRINKKKIIHDKKLSIPNVTKKNSMLYEKMKTLNKLSLTMTKDNFFVEKVKNKSKIPVIKKVIKIDSCSVPGYSSPGVSKINQDNYFIIKEFLNTSEQFFMGLCDGHGSFGNLISKYMCNLLPKKITKLSEKNIFEAFLSANKSLIEESKIDCSLSGTTCTSLILSSNKVISANVGNSRAVLARYENGQYHAINLTRDHVPTELDEMKRIIKSDGRIKQLKDPRSGKSSGPERIWLKNSEIPGLEISRSLGDNLAHSIGVICEPEIKTIDFNGNEKFILLASDGIWKFIDSDECVRIIKDYYENSFDAVGALNKLVKQAFKRWKDEEDSIDNITAILTFFD
jgi:serine/threonine protein phosphatase PrpC